MNWMAYDPPPSGHYRCLVEMQDSTLLEAMILRRKRVWWTLWLVPVWVVSDMHLQTAKSVDSADRFGGGGDSG